MLFSALRVLWGDHGRQAIPNLELVELPAPFRGIPRLRSKGLPKDELERVAALCPTGAISTKPFALDMGRCLFCGECAHRLPDHIHFTQDWHLASSTREGLVVPADVEAYRPEVEANERFKKVYRNSLPLRQVCAGGDGAGELELGATDNVNFDMRRHGIEWAASPRHAGGIVVTGPVTAKMAGPLQETFDAVPSPQVLIAVGTDAISGGLFVDNGAIDRSFFERHTPDLYVAGHPAHPLAFINGVRRLLGQL